LRRFQFAKAYSGGGRHQRVIIEEGTGERLRRGEAIELFEALRCFAPHAGVGIFERADE